MSRRAVLRQFASFLLIFVCASAVAQTSRNLVTNDDNPAGNTATFYSLGANGNPTQVAVVPTGGLGGDGGYFALPRVSVARGNGECVYVANGASSDITSIFESTLTVAGTFKAGLQDSGPIGLAMNGRGLYAGFQHSDTIAAFGIGANCTLQLLGDVSVSGVPDGMKIYGNLLVVAYVDGFIESFDLTGGVPVSKW